MIQVSDAFKVAMKQPVKEVTSYLEFDDIKIDAQDDLISLKISCETGLCKTAMRKMEAKLHGDHNVIGKWIKAFGGVKVADGTFEYIGYGSFLVNKVMYDKSSNTTTVLAYDKMINTMRAYVALEITYPITLLEYARVICAVCGLELGEDFTVHADLPVTSDLFSNISGITYRDILVQIAQVCAATCIIGSDDKVYFKQITDTAERLSYDNIFSLTLEPIYGEINSVILSRTPQEDNIYLQDSESIDTNGLTEFKIENNQFVDKIRDEALPDIYNALKGISFYPYEARTEGFGWYEIGDKITIVNDSEEEFSVVVFNFNLLFDGGIKEVLKASAESKTQTQYQYASTINKRLSNTEIIVDKQNEKITSVVEKVDESTQKISEFTIDINGIKSSVSEAVTTSEEAKNTADAANEKVENFETSIQQTKDNILLEVKESYASKTALASVETKADNAQSTADDALESAENNAKDMATIVTSFNADVENLQTQIDGSITTWFYEVEPTDSNEPAVNWTTTDLKNNHLGDLYYDTITGYCYRYQVQNNSYSWQRITDTDVTKALSDAQAAQDTADQKRRVFYTQPTPPYDAGDLWVQGSGGDILRCKTAKTSSQSYAAADWVKASKYTDDTVAELAQATIDKYLSQTELIVGTQTAATGSWTGQASFSELINNMQIAYWLPYAGSGNASLNLTLADGTTTGAIPCYYSGTSRLTTHYGAGNVIRFVYRENVTIGSTIIEKGFWADANYNTDSNTYDRIRFSNSIKAKSAIAAGKIIVGDSSGYFPLAASTAFDITNPPLYAGSAIAASVTGTNNYLSYPSVNLRTTLSGFTGTAYKTVYVVGTLNGKTFTPNATLITSTEPTSEDGLTYIALGYLVSTYQIYLYPEHPMYRYYNGGFKTINQIAYDAFVAINDLNVGSRNLLKLSNPNISSATYNIKKFYFGDSPPEDGEEVTVSLKGTLGSGKVRWGLYNSGGTVNCTNLTADDLDDDGVYRKTFTWKVGSAANTFLSIYAMLNSVSATSSIEWIKLERGNKATDWSPAPEDQVGKSNVIASINASTEGVAISGKKISLDGFVAITNSAEGDDVTNQISMLPGETYTPPEYEWDTNVVIKTERIYDGAKTITFILDDDGNIGLLNGGSVYVIDDYIHTPIMVENASHDSGSYIRAYQICTPQLILGDVGDVGDKISALSTVTKSGYFAKVGNLAMANVYGASTSALPTVPSGYRPSYIVSCPATIILNGNAYMGYVTINTSGVITPYYYDYGSAPKSPVTGCTVYFLATWIIA